MQNNSSAQRSIDESKGLPTATLDLSYSHENTTMKTLQNNNLTTTAMNLELRQHSRQSKQSYKNVSNANIPRNIIQTYKSEQELEFLSSPNSVSQASVRPPLSGGKSSIVPEVKQAKKIEAEVGRVLDKPEDNHMEEEKHKDTEQKNKIIEMSPSQVFNDLIRRAEDGNSQEPDEFQRALL